MFVKILTKLREKKQLPCINYFFGPLVFPVQNRVNSLKNSDAEPEPPI